jgi:poly-gamma-glutamate capsule biosynthesis protein CapA/YwtB (metallophosphatase superfamily)
MLCAPLLALLLVADPPSITIQAVGDLNLSGDAEGTMRAKGYPHAFEGTRALLAEGDLNVANLETPITTRGQKQAKRFTFRMAPASAKAIAEAKILLVSQANNHAIDYGLQGMEDTLVALDRAGIAHAGAGKNLQAARAPAIVQVKGVKVGLLSYSLTFPSEFYATVSHGGTAHGEASWIAADVKALRPQVDLVLVTFHWSAELLETPKDYQRELGHLAIDAGADAVIGTHPHILQGIERYHDKPILYSMGNYAFGSRSHKAADSALVRLTFAGGTLTALTAVPLDVDNTHLDFDPQVAHGPAAARINAKLAGLSSALGTKLSERDERLELAPSEREREQPGVGPQVDHPTGGAEVDVHAVDGG